MMKGSLVNTAVLTRLPFILRCGVGRYSKKKMILYFLYDCGYCLTKQDGFVKLHTIIFPFILI